MRPMKQAVYSSRTADKFVVRLPDGMRERIAEVARNHHRSMNSEIIARLERSLNDPTQAEEDINTLDVPVDPWTPVEGMLVTFRKGPQAGKPYMIHGFEFTQDLKLGADLDIGSITSLTALKPYLVV